ncbi:MAG: PIN domain-containing protein [Chloroflexota bacterium]
MTRLWVDANVVLRFLTGEPEPMAARAARLMVQAEQGEISLFIAPLVLAEIIWVLKSFYRHPMAAIAEAILALVSADGIEVEDRELTVQAIELARDRNVDFVDAYLAVQAASRGETVCTFDGNDFRRLPARWVLPE